MTSGMLFTAAFFAIRGCLLVPIRFVVGFPLADKTALRGILCLDCRISCRKGDYGSCLWDGMKMLGEKACKMRIFGFVTCPVVALFG